MSRRKGSIPRRRDVDDDFNRNNKLLSARDTGERQLFDPRSDHPIAFNKAATTTTTTTTTKKEEESRQFISPNRRHVDKGSINTSRKNADNGSFDTSRRPPPASGRRLWNADDNSPSSSPSPKPIINNNKPKNLDRLPIPKPTTPKILSSSTTPSSGPTPEAVKNTAAAKKKSPPPPKEKKKPLTEEEQQKEFQRKKWKSLVASLKTIETKLEALSSTSRTLSCFNDDDDDDDDELSNRRRRRSMDEPIDTQDTVLVEQDVIDAEKIWKEKIQLHLSLGEKYLEILNCDLEYAEKKGLESLCWKRAVYSLVDQFRRALKKSAAASANANAAAASAATGTAPPAVKPTSELAALLLLEEDDDDDKEEDDTITEIPVINESGGMTFIKVEKTQEETTQDDKLLIKQTRMILTLFLEYLDLVDNFYRKLTLFLKTVDDDKDSDMENYLIQWRRTRKYKWYTCIPLRGDIARYRWSYTPEDEINTNDVEYDNMVTPVTQWTKYKSFQEAWGRYFLGIWLMPAKGNLYFNLSLLLQQPKTTPGYEFHKLYLSTRSLMVRRNGFLNARESMLVLFENNRIWIHKNLRIGSSNTTKQKINRRPVVKPRLNLDKDATIPALFVRLHGMLFTKIGLDEFSNIKRLFFDALFEKNHQPNQKEDGFDKPPPIILNKVKPMENDPKQLSESHFFWFETVILCLSSLYTYDYANSKLTKLLSSNSVKLFYPDSSDELQQQQHQTLLEDLGESILFTYEINLTCQIAVELFQRYLDPLLPCPTIPVLPKLPHVSLTFKDNKEFLFGDVQDTEKGTRIHDNNEQVEELELDDTDNHAWLVYIEILLHWMVLNGICIRSKDRISLWESLVGDIGYDLISQQRFTHSRSSKISSAFWPLLLQFLNKLLGELPEEDKYDMVNKHLMDDEDDGKSTTSSDKFSEAEYAFAKNISMILGHEPDLPEEDYLRGLGWVDEIHGRFLKLEQEVKDVKIHGEFDTVMRRKVKILDYGFTLVKHLDDILYYDPVEEIFTVSKTVEERAFALDHETSLNQSKDNYAENLYDDENESVVTTIAEMDDDVLLSSETECSDEKYEGDDIMTQLKKRREQLQSIVASAEQEERFGYRRLPARAKEREARLNYLRECIIPGKTILVLDTNCFIGHIDHVKKLLQSKKWSIIVPLVVVTELDGLRTNPQRLGLVAQQGIELLRTTLASKPTKQSTQLRIQTSHNNFMNDISIRSEQFVFGETDKNLDDLILSSCLWWISQQGPKDSSEKAVPVCLVTGDRNLSVKARARDVEVVPVSAIIQLTPKD